MQKLSQTEELARELASHARRHTVTPEQISRAMDEKDYDVAQLDELYAALETAAYIWPKKRPSCRRWTKHRSAGWSTSFLPKAWHWMTR